MRLADGRQVALQALAVASRFVARSTLLASLGVPTAAHPSGMGVHVPSGLMGRTDIDGVWVAGNVTDPMAWVITAASQGGLAGAAVNGDLVVEDTERALQAA